VTRGLSPSMLTGIARTDVRPILLFEGQFDGGFVRFWTGYGTISWNGSDWIGAGQLIGISDIEENAEVVATGITVSLSGVDPALVSAVIGEARQNMVGRIWIGLLRRRRHRLARLTSRSGAVWTCRRSVDGGRDLHDLDLLRERAGRSPPPARSPVHRRGAEGDLPR
jgi:hypothetical protein